MRIPPGLYDRKTWHDMCLFLFWKRVEANRKDDGYTYSDFNLYPLIGAWEKRCGAEAQMRAFEAGVAGSHPPPSPEQAVRAIDEGPKTIDHSTGKEVTTKAWAALHGW